MILLLLRERHRLYGEVEVIRLGRAVPIHHIQPGMTMEDTPDMAIMVDLDLHPSQDKVSLQVFTRRIGGSQLLNKLSHCFMRRTMQEVIGQASKAMTTLMTGQLNGCGA